MTTAEQILAEVLTLPEAQAREVLDFVAFLKSRLQRNKADISRELVGAHPAISTAKSLMSN